MTSRAQDSAAIVAARMAKSAEEMSHWSQYADGSAAPPTACRTLAGCRQCQDRDLGIRDLAVLLMLGPMLWRDAAAAQSSLRQAIVLASTTSVENSDLLAKILPLFTKQTGVEVRVIAQGTGQALATALGPDDPWMSRMTGEGVMG
jgi:hypothetical protein